MKFPFLLGLLVIAACVHAQNIELQVGDRIPTDTIGNVSNYKKAYLTFQDFSGRWLIIDLWTLGCKSCLENFEKMNDIQNTLKDNLNVVLIGRIGREIDMGIEKVYHRLEKTRSLNLIAAFDSTVFRKWGIETVPHIYIVDPEGNIRFITDGRDLNAIKLRKLIVGDDISFYKKNATVNSNGHGSVASEHTIYASVINKWNNERQYSGYDIDRYVNFPPEYWTKGWSVTMAPLFELYNFAYFGRAFWLPGDSAFYNHIYSTPILKIKDKTDFAFDFKNDVGSGTYNYALTLPPARVNQTTIMTELQKALHTTFGYRAKVETMKVDVWKLISINKSIRQLRSKSVEAFISAGSPAGGFTIKKNTVKQLLNILISTLPNEGRLAFFDETDIDYPIDLTMEADMTNIFSVRAELQRNGLDLIKGKRKMKVLVISDK